MKKSLGVGPMVLFGVAVTGHATGLPTPPEAQDDSVAIHADGTTNVPVLFNDSDLSGDSLSVIAVSDPANGTTAINPDNTVQYVPDAGYSGSDSFTYTISDGTDESEILLTASDAEVGDKFSIAVDVSGDVMAISASTADVGPLTKAGVLYVFRRRGGSWIEEAILTASDAGAADQFGKDVDVDGDRLVVGAYVNDEAAKDAGAAYVFHWNGLSWVMEAKLMTSDAADDDQFGRFVGISGDTIAVAAWRDDTDAVDSGSAYVFRWNGSSWVEEAKLTAGDAAAGDAFGRDIDISGDVIVAGAGPSDSAAGTDAGAAYVFRRSGSTWNEEAKLTAGDAAAEDRFGRAVSVSGDTILVGALKDDDKGRASGSAYVFEWDGSGWTETNKLVATDGRRGDRFGIKVDVHQDFLVVGAALSDGSGADSGSAYLFQRNGGDWVQHRKFTASNAAPGAKFGKYVAIHANTVVIGSHNAVSETGFAYVYPVGTDTATVTVTVTMPNNGVPVTADGHRAIGGRIATLAWFLGGLIVFVVVVAGLVAVRR